MNIEELKNISRPQLKQLSQVVETSKHLLILTHGNPDPDSIAGAFALKYLVNKLANCRVRVAFRGVVGRMENKAMVKELNLLMLHLDEIDWRSYDCIALVDHQPRRGMYSWPRNRWPDIVIDHHPRLRLPKPVSFIDVRTFFGSSSALLASYLLCMDELPPRWLTTALAYGIQTDTQNFTRGNVEKDILIYQWLFKQIDHKKLYRISNPINDCRYISDHWNGMKNARIWKDIGTSYCGQIFVPDLTSHVADDIITIKGVHYALASGYHGETCYFSLRIKNTRRDAGSLMRKLIKRRGSAGGHGFMAGGQIKGVHSEEEASTIAERVNNELLKILYQEELDEGRSVIED